MALPQLQAKHQKRIAEEVEFKYLNDDIALYNQEKDQKTVSLNEKERLAKKDSETARELKRLNERLVRLKLPPVKSVDDAPEVLEKLDPLLEETVLITEDLVMSSKIAKK